jgi:hypothetical protein
MRNHSNAQSQDEEHPKGNRSWTERGRMRIPIWILKQLRSNEECRMRGRYRLIGFDMQYDPPSDSFYVAPRVLRNSVEICDIQRATWEGVVELSNQDCHTLHRPLQIYTIIWMIDWELLQFRIDKFHTINWMDNWRVLRTPSERLWGETGESISYSTDR